MIFWEESVKWGRGLPSNVQFKFVPQSLENVILENNNNMRLQHSHFIIPCLCKVFYLKKRKDVEGLESFDNLDFKDLSELFKNQSDRASSTFPILC